MGQAVGRLLATLTALVLVFAGTSAGAVALADHNTDVWGKTGADRDLQWAPYGTTDWNPVGQMPGSIKRAIAVKGMNRPAGMPMPYSLEIRIVCSWPTGETWVKTVYGSADLAQQEHDCRPAQNGSPGFASNDYAFIKSIQIRNDTYGIMTWDWHGGSADPPPPADPVGDGTNPAGQVCLSGTELTRLQVAEILYTAGFRGTSWVVGIAITAGESGWDPNATNSVGNSAGVDRGLWQINSYYHPTVSDAQAFDPVYATEYAFKISSGGSDYSPWSVYKNGAYLGHMDNARAAVAEFEAGQRGDEYVAGPNPCGGPSPVNPDTGEVEPFPTGDDLTGADNCSITQLIGCLSRLVKPSAETQADWDAFSDSLIDVVPFSYVADGVEVVGAFKDGLYTGCADGGGVAGGTGVCDVTATARGGTLSGWSMPGGEDGQHQNFDLFGPGTCNTSQPCGLYSFLIDVRPFTSALVYLGLIVPFLYVIAKKLWPVASSDG